MSLTYRCETCQEILKSWAAAERHSDQNNHHRLSILGLGLLLPDEAP